MLLLSVVSINLIQNLGLIEKVKLAKEEHRASTIQEQKELFEKEIEISKYEGNTPKTINDLLDKLEEEKLITEEEKNTIMQKGRITIGSKKIIFDTIILPEGYTRCEYLESTGTQWILTDIYPSNNEIIEIKAEFLELLQNRGFYGVHAGNGGGKWFDLLFAKNNQTLSFYAYSTESSTEIKIELNKIININCEVNGFNASVRIDENHCSFYSPKNNISPYPVGLFTVSYVADGKKNYAIPKSRIYSYRHYYNNVLDCNMIPCLDKNGRPCMYDTVSGKTFYNQGTGEFIAGPVVE